MWNDSNMKKSNGSYVVLDAQGNRISSDEWMQYFWRKTAVEIAKFLQFATWEKMRKRKSKKN